MTPEQRLDRLERIATLLATADWRACKGSPEQARKLQMIIAAQKDWDEKLAFLGVSKTTYKRRDRMPTILRIGPYRFFFYSSDGEEPPHIHVVRDDHVAKVWLDPVALDRRGAFRGTEINRVLKIVEEHREELLRGWNEYFNS